MIFAPLLAAGLLGAAPVDAGGAPAYVASDAAVPLTGVALVVRAGVDRESDAQNGLAALVAETVLRTTVDGLPLIDAVAAHGGSVSYTISPRGVRFALEAPPDALPGVAPLLARALASPSFDAATLASARAALGERIASDQHNPVFVGLDALRAAHYRDAGALPALGTPATLAGFLPEDARAFHARWYVRGNAFVVTVGRTGATSDAAQRALVAALPAGTVPAQTPFAVRPFAKEPRRIVTRRDVFVPYVVLGFAAPAMGSADFPAALVLRAMLDDLFGSDAAFTTSAVRRPVGAVYAYDIAPAYFAVWINGARLDPSAGLSSVAAVLKATSQKPLAAAALDRYKQTADGQWRTETTTLDDASSAIAGAVALGLDADARGAVPASIARVRPADVQRVAKRWFEQFDVALVLPRGGTGG